MRFLSLILLFFSQLSHAQIIVGSVIHGGTEDKLSEGSVAAVAIGSAVLVVLALIALFRWLRKPVK